MISLRKAINAMCKECLYDPGHGAGAWREQITACTAQACPLYQVRPKSRVQTQEDRKTPQPEALAKANAARKAARSANAPI